MRYRPWVNGHPGTEGVWGFPNRPRHGKRNGVAGQTDRSQADRSHLANDDAITAELLPVVTVGGEDERGSR